MPKNESGVVVLGNVYKKRKIFNPELKNTMSSVVGGAGEASQPASAPSASAGTGAVMASVDNNMFLNFLNMLKTPENVSLIESVILGYNLLYESGWEVKHKEGKSPIKTNIKPEDRELSNLPKYSTGKSKVRFQDWLELDDYKKDNVAKSSNGKWYGWSHRAVHGFAIGDKVKKGDCGYEYKKKEYTIKTDAQAQEAATNFADSVS